MCEAVDGAVQSTAKVAQLRSWIELRQPAGCETGSYEQRRQCEWSSKSNPRRRLREAKVDCWAL
jgi:hypothetical protein